MAQTVNNTTERQVSGCHFLRGKADFRERDQNTVSKLDFQLRHALEIERLMEGILNQLKSNTLTLLFFI